MATVHSGMCGSLGGSHCNARLPDPARAAAAPFAEGLRRALPVVGFLLGALCAAFVYGLNAGASGAELWQ
jgi:hypothetical protein